MQENTTTEYFLLLLEKPPEKVFGVFFWEMMFSTNAMHEQKRRVVI